ncbi:MULTISPECIES: hypothetical protein [unclassified Rothia (in: high G+C Gram-positive bacteria)]|uniref:hypothetical protein n=1 Tax=unclassified Rothia (in: high G+C Gram-positive bacteria) TaxID=2689056 RepID=UPI001956BCDA|nr:MULTISPECIES: hypothetical protein [unclassified Rothia (in: high G+C Gram-positive bacteria)]MBM7050793.1 hypothetical protein [Rothia sp. ZJ1223]QRZ60966.1 hypothetical protein JR346_06775 [Rothia sp. ZJ932]
MASELILGITLESTGTYQAALQGDYGVAKPLLDLVDAADYTHGVLDESEASAYVLAEFLLEHQEAGLLPPIVEISDVVAAYDQAIERFAELK